MGEEEEEEEISSCFLRQRLARQGKSRMNLLLIHLSVADLIVILFQVGGLTLSPAPLLLLCSSSFLVLSLLALEPNLSNKILPSCFAQIYVCKAFNLG